MGSGKRFLFCCGAVLAIVISVVTADEPGESRERKSRVVPLENLYPLEVTAGLTIDMGGPPVADCFHVPLEIEVNCPGARTCGCQSSILTVTVDGMLTVLHSRLDEISDVFEKDAVFVNVTLCRPPAAVRSASAPSAHA
eukprot:CAMPEP_0181294960 /NCGR_PEP_ID=MMETSP1101-20121128/3885_1 /TAXON_ID=46948 /ORGANISM="Rhodomonas abbreviata, Strain Caron Lab Isolate" /LENGTH=138 /DNA_ID=CAMNT_0023399665 /DNA_START=9 /DNA_END=422 /DNA_ORIENTATION=+